MYRTLENVNQGGSPLKEVEFIAIIASMMALAALSTDALLPGLSEIGNSIGTSGPQTNQLLITTLVLGMGVGQIISGTISDSLGRKPVVYIGYFIFFISSLICIYSTNLELMITGRLLQGIGLSAPRTISISIIRDKYAGNHMARIMSFITAIFILVPIIAPTFGKVMLENFGWESIFYSQILFGLIAVAWFGLRQPETLETKYRKKLTLSLLLNGFLYFWNQKTSVLLTIVVGVITAPMLAYISASQHIFEVQYNLKEIYPYIFSGIAIGIGISTYLNGLIVMKYGMVKVAQSALISIIILAALYSIFYINKNPPISILITLLGLILFAIGFIIGNINAIAMQPLGQIAGIGAAIIGFFSTIITVVLSIIIGLYINTLASPICISFLLCASLSLTLLQLINVQKTPPKTS